jgi:hypothetical protein
MYLTYHFPRRERLGLAQDWLARFGIDRGKLRPDKAKAGGSHLGINLPWGHADPLHLLMNAARQAAAEVRSRPEAPPAEVEVVAPSGLTPADRKVVLFHREEAGPPDDPDVRAVCDAMSRFAG